MNSTEIKIVCSKCFKELTDMEKKGCEFVLEDITKFENQLCDEHRCARLNEKCYNLDHKHFKGF